MGMWIFPSETEPSARANISATIDVSFLSISTEENSEPIKTKQLFR